MNVPIVYELHAPIEECGVLARYIFGKLIRSPFFRNLVVISHSLRRHFEERWPILKNRIVVAPDGADQLRKATEKVYLSGSKGRLKVGYTGHFYHGKGVDLILQIARGCPHFEFHIVGGNDADIRRVHDLEKIPSNLRFHGYKPHREVARYIKSFDVALLPNQPDVYGHGGKCNIGRWTSPLKLFEYMAAGRAIICSDIPVLREIACDGVNMLVCPYDKPDVWVAALDYLAACPDRREALGIAALDEFEKKYTWEQRAKNILDNTGIARSSSVK
jgi:glycosyltransferase involved in cell wall biosynthesis